MSVSSKRGYEITASLQQRRLHLLLRNKTMKFNSIVGISGHSPFSLYAKIEEIELIRRRSLFKNRQNMHQTPGNKARNKLLIYTVQGVTLYLCLSDWIIIIVSHLYINNF